MTENDSPIAVIGMALRAPGADTPEEFWDNVLAGRDSLTRPTESQLRRLGVPEHFIRDPMYVRARPLLKSPGAFDPEFFNSSAAAAKTTDPCHRLFMMCAWEAMERAGVIPGADAGVVGVFGGVTYGQDSYVLRNFGGGRVDLDDPTVWLPVNVGGNTDQFTSRVSYHFDLHGPNVSVQAACATSLVALHLAVTALRHGDCEIALTGGAAVGTPHWPGYFFVEGGPVSPTGVVRPFDEQADGTIFGSGVGAVVLKRLDEALAQGDNVHGVILGTGICNDGGQKDNLAAPALSGQIGAITRALDMARVGPETIGLLEAHGTGTLVGDPIEVQATCEAYQRSTDKRQYCALGAVKANIGHAGAAAGVLGLIKACMALERGVIPPNIHYERPNPRLDLPSTPFYIPTEATPWRTEGHPRRAGVSAFGFGGNNAHAVLEAPPPRPDGTVPNRPTIVVLSARTAVALDRQVERLCDHLHTHSGDSLENIAHTLRAGRKSWPHRAAVVASEPVDAASRFSQHLFHQGQSQEERPVVFALPGQGSQRAGMGRVLYDEDADYRSDVDHCAEELLPHLDLDIRTLLNANPDDDGATQTIKQTAFAQPTLFTVEYALARRLMAFGIQPTAIIGHSIGELAAACLAEVFSLTDALRLVALRGKLMQACDPGSMLAVFLEASDIPTRLGEGVEIAALNSPGLTIVSGPSDAIETARVHLNNEGVMCRALHTSHGFHSKSMDPAIAPFFDAVAKVKRSAPRLPFVSCVTGHLITDDEATNPSYWAQQIRQPVQFAQGVQTLAQIDGAAWIEVGPGSALSSLVKQQADIVAMMTTLDADHEDRRGFLDVLSRMWVEGVPLVWDALVDRPGLRKVVLPTYPFETKHYWVDPPVFQRQRLAGSQPPPGSESSPVEGTLHVRGWRASPLRSPVLSRDEGWLVFEDALGLGARLAERLRNAGVRVVSLRPGFQFEDLDADCFGVRPGAAEDLSRVLQSAPSGWTPRRVVHLWLVDGGADNSCSPVDLLDTCLSPGFETLAALVRALDDQGVTESVDVTVVADGVTLLDGEAGEIRWEKSSLLGPCRVAPKEMPSLACQLVDVREEAIPTEWIVDAVLAEASQPEAGTLKLLREDGRHIEAFAPLPDSFGNQIRPGGAVLVTGGVGGLGLEVAGRLHEISHCRLALLTRWQPPPEEDWPTRARSDDRIGRALGKVLELRADGAEVILVRGDVTKPADMMRVVEEVRARFGTLHGVVHAAGVVSPALIFESNRQRIDEVFAPKVKGALVLEDVLGEQPLDFFISFSSIASVAPSRGQADYSAANAVLDSLARRRVARMWDRVCSISWDAWQEVGMAADDIRRTAGSNSRATRNEARGVGVGPNRRLSMRDIGDLSSFELTPFDLTPPNKGEVQIEVYVAGLNFHDVLLAVGGLTDVVDDRGPVGSECSGRVVAVGPGVEEFSVGDPVIALADGAFASRVNADVRLVVPKPDNIDFEEAAGVGIVFLTAMYALNNLGRLTQGERVLIHSAAGGVGLAAIQIAKAAEAEIFATAGSDEKREYLRELGVAQVMDSRSLGFVEQLDRETGGTGIDVVLNSLAGEFIQAGLGTLRPMGRFLEIGKRDILDNAPVGLLPFGNNLSFHGIDLGRMIQDRQPTIVHLLRELMADLGQGRLHPVATRAVSWEDARQAMEHMSSAHHVGKVVFVIRPPSERVRPGPTEEEAFKLGYAWSLPLTQGLDILQELLQSADLPHHVIASRRPLQSGMSGETQGTLPKTEVVEIERVNTVTYKAPCNSIEEQIVAIWEEVLSIGSIGMDDDFFELGGDSISSMQILNRIRKVLQARFSHDALQRMHTPALLSEAVHQQLEGGH